MIAQIKPGKDPTISKNYRPIPLLCILYKVYERMILARISQKVEEHLSPDQAGFCPGRSCCDQLLNLTQHIEDGFEKKQITGTVFVDLTVAYDIVNHRKFLLKVAKVTHNTKIVSIIQSLMSNRASLWKWMERKAGGDYKRMDFPKAQYLHLSFSTFTPMQ